MNKETQRERMFTGLKSSAEMDVNTPNAPIKCTTAVATSQASAVV